MKILAFDLSTSTCAVALNLFDEQITCKKEAPQQQARLILPMIHEALMKNQLSVKDLDGIAYGCGPGSFTGIRIANSVAQGLGYGSDLPLMPISSLAGLAQSALTHLQQSNSSSSYLILPAYDARMSQIYIGAYLYLATNPQQREKQLVTSIAKDQLLDPGHLISFLSQIDQNIPLILVGDAWHASCLNINNDLERNYQLLDYHFLNIAEGILSLGKEMWLQKKWVCAKEALPVYLRE